MKKIKVGIVNYLNTAPLIYGLRNSSLKESMELIPDYPSNLARDLELDRIDLGLVPVAVIPDMNEWHLVGDHCIGCDGPVASVCIFSELPLEKIERIILDYQSRTSVELAKILLRDHWKKEVEFIPAGGEEFINRIGGTTAGLVIGDRALRKRKTSAFVYDLGEAWKVHTGLPFVFAAWISNKPLSPGFIGAFNQANAYGVNHMEEVIAMQSFPDFDLNRYFSENISYTLDEMKKKGLERFLNETRLTT